MISLNGYALAFTQNKKKDLEIRHIMLKWRGAFLCSAVLAKYDHK